ncbi:peptide ABC transporter substrate-binding protein [Devosia sp.]|uniref:peptide ABC transporter substrate-binding protein n=1 Tax=Devosia sp. TaxID=1871048 RepID=UPI002AFF0F32|nr:peptide ABC transporter substrate-binding protein [Devosia sp.]
MPISILNGLRAGLILCATALVTTAMAADTGTVHAPGGANRGTYFDYMKTVYAHAGLPFLIQVPITAFDSNYQLHGLAAESWEQSGDQLTWTFHLRDGLSYTDGTPLTAHDYVFALQRAASQGYDFGWYWSGAGVVNWAGVESGALPPEDLGVSAPDDLTLNITTSAPRPFLPSVVSLLFPVPRHVVEKLGDDYALNADTIPATGPFRIESWDRGSNVVTYARNESYTGPWTANVDRVITDPSVSSPEVALPAFMAGEVDFTILNAGQIPFAQQRFPDQIRFNAVFATSYLAFDPEIAPFDNPLVRQAFYYAIDREELTQTVLRNLAIPAGSILPPNFPGYDEGVAGQAVFDPERAKALLAEAGYPGGEGFPEIEVYFRVQGGYNGVISAPMLQYLQAQFAETLGVHMELRLMPLPDWQQAMADRTNGLFLAPYEADYIDPSNFYGLFHEGGRHHYDVASYDALVDEADAESDWDKRVKLYADAEQVLIDEALIVPLVHPVQMYVVNQRLSGPSVEANAIGMTPMDQQRTYFYTHVKAE